MNPSNTLAMVPAGLPDSYLAARQALARCEQVDECHDWANKAAALASYAKQSKDDTLVIIAQRIQARAIRRCGELLGQLPALKGVKQPEKTARTRTAVARAAGLSTFRQATAMQVAAVPTARFEREVEGDNPPTVAKLAALGRKRGRPHKQVACCPTCGRAL